MSTSAPKRPIITSSDRLVLTLFLALAFHALLILGVSFTLTNHDKPKIIDTLNITLVNTRSPKAPDKADYRAQENQAGGGNTAKRVPKKAPTTVPTPSKTPGRATVNAPPTHPKPPTAKRRPVLTTAKSDRKADSAPPRPEATPKPRISAQQLMQSSTQEIARLEARTQRSWQIYSDRPDPKYIYANTRKTEDAAYLESWTRKVEGIGNLNYPDAARRKGLSGSLVMEVTERADGSVVSVKIIDSSGHRELDDAAIRIVHLASPFAPVPNAVLDGKSELRIVRVWMFTSGNELIGR